MATRNDLADTARVLAVQQARTLYSIFRSAEIVARRSTPDVDSNYYFREYKKLCGKIDMAIAALTDMRKEAAQWQTKQAHGGDTSDAIERILQCLRYIKT